MERLPFDHYYDSYMARMGDFQVHRDFMKILEWVKDKPGHVTNVNELACVISGVDDPGEDDVRAAMLAMGILTSWPEAIGDLFFEVRSADGSLYPVYKLPQEALDGHVPYVLEATGETIEDFPSSAYVRIRIADFVPTVDLEDKPSIGMGR